MRMPGRCTLLALAVAAAAAAAVAGALAGAAAPAPAHPRRILVLTETRGYRHASIPAAAAALKRLAGADHPLEFTFLPNVQSLTSTELRGASAVVFLLTSGELPLSASGKRALVAFVNRGGGLIGFHSATDTFHHWAGFTRLIGAEFSHHPLPRMQRIIVEDRGNPSTRALPASFHIFEEFYVFKRDPRPRVHVLARLDTGPGGPDRPLVWCRRVGAGRVFYDALGHFIQTWQDSHQLDLVVGGIEWASGLARAGDC
jgi:type 1 glutamine amidotransferase